MKTIEVQLYKFDELTEEAKNKARLDHIEFLQEDSFHYFDDNGNVKPEFDNYYVVDVIREMERMQTPWFFAETLFHEHRESIDFELKENDYDFTEDGEIY